MRKILKILRNFILVILFFVVILFVLGKVFEKDIINKAITTLNTKIKTPISVNKITLNVFRQFPNITIELHNVKVNSSEDINTNHFKNIDTNYFLNIDKVILSFNAKALINNVYELNKIILENGNINVLIDKNGKNNYVAFSSAKADSSSKSNTFHLFLNSLKLKNINFNLYNAYKNEKLQLFANNFQVKGEFYQKKYKAFTKGSIQVKKYLSKNVNFEPKHNTLVKTELNISNDTIMLNKATLYTKGIGFNAYGIIILNSHFVDITLKGNDIEIESLLKFLPQKKLIKDIEAKGILAINTKIKGEWTATKTPKTKSIYSIEKGVIVYKKKELNFDKITLNGSFSSYSKPMVSISKFSFSVLESNFSGSASVSNFRTPMLNLSTRFDINLFNISNIVDTKKVLLKNGNATGTMKINGLVKQKMFETDWLNLDYNAKIILNNINLTLLDSNLDINNINANMFINNNLVEIKKLSANCLDVSVLSNANIYEPMKLLTDKDKKNSLSLMSNISVSGRLDYNKIKPLFATNSNKKQTKNNSINILINSDILIEEFVYNKFVGKNISGRISYKQNNLLLHNFNFYAFGGNIKSTSKIKMFNNDKIKIYTNTSTNNVSINQVFRAFDNFNQDFIVANNLKGKLNANTEGDFWVAGGKTNSKDIDLLGHVKITDGELINFEPVQKLAAFSEIPELKHLKFATLENDIMIANNKIIIPKMDIVTNAMDISLFGNQEFDGKYEYHIKLLLSEIISGKKRILKRQNSKFGKVEDDGLGKTSVYLVATGEKGNTKIRFDRKELSKHLKKEIQKEKKVLKKVLNKEFGWFKKDSLPSKKDTMPKKHFEIEWDDE